jgi:hypothetical protein
MELLHIFGAGLFLLIAISIQIVPPNNQKMREWAKRVCK